MAALITLGNIHKQSYRETENGQSVKHKLNAVHRRAFQPMSVKFLVANPSV